MTALNDVVLEKLARDHQVALGVYLAGRLLASYSADAVIVATPTGSTAYSFAAGGPILSPNIEAVVFTPVAPHMTFNRTVVAAPDEPVALRVLPHSGQAAVSIDGQLRGVLDPGDWIGVYGSPRRLRLVRLASHRLLRPAARPLPAHRRARDRARRRVRPVLAADHHRSHQTWPTSRLPPPPGRRPVGSLLMRNVVILAGGSGTRLWPLSRDDRPKQVLPLAAGDSLLRVAYNRLRGLVEPANIYVCTVGAYTDVVRKELPELGEHNIIGEPARRDTANAVGLASAVVARNDPDAVVAFVGSDHLISPEDEFRAAIESGFEVVEQRARSLVTFGIEPTHPHTGLGYVERGDADRGHRGVRRRPVPGEAGPRDRRGVPGHRAVLVELRACSSGGPRPC